MTIPAIQGNFSGGELCPDLFGHVDLARYHSAAATARNLFVNFRGGLYSRAGTALVGRCKQAGNLAPPRDIPFQFSLNQRYALEFGDQYMRIKSQGAYVLEPAKTITGATQANPCQITSAAHGFSNGDWVFIQGVQGMTQLNQNTYIVAGVTANTFTLQNLDGVAIDATGYSAYTSGGTVARLYTLVTPYAAVDLPYLKYTQSADVVSLTCVNLLTGTEYPPQELSRLGATNWTIAALNIGTSLTAPTGLTATASDNPNSTSTPPTKPCAYAYEVTTVNALTGEESNPSARVDVTNSIDMGVTAGSITVTWNAVQGTNRQYNIYRTAPNYNTKPSSTTVALPAPAGSFFFFAGSSYGTSFVDTNTVTDAAKTPPLHQDPFARGKVTSINVTASSADWTTATVSITTATGSGFQGEVVVSPNGGPGSIVAVIIKNPGRGYLGTDTVSFAGGGTSASATLAVSPQSGTYPAVAAYFQQRRIYAQTLNQPDTFFASQSGRFTNFDEGNPPTDTDAITSSPFSQAVDGIQWLIPMPGGLVILTGSSAWQLTGTGGSALNPQPLTPSSEQAQSQAFNGVSATVIPQRINYNILYVGARGSIPYELNYNIYFNIYYANDLGWPSAHLFQGHQILQWTWAETPFKIIWAVREDGALLSLTYVKEQEVAGWTRHDTQGLVQSVCTVTEPPAFGALYLSPLDALYLIVERYINGAARYFAERMDARVWPSAENSWCVDCGLSTLGPAAYRQAGLTANAAIGGGVIFTASANVFSGGDVGSIIRMGGGIATITSVTDAMHVVGIWTRPLVQVVPGDGTVPTFLAGQWSILPQITTVTGLSHLVARSVVGLADGIPVGPLTVTSQGTVTLPFAASLVTIGLAFTPQFQSVYLENGQPTLQGRRKSINHATIRIANSGMPNVLINQPDGSALDPPQLAPAWGTGQQAKFAPAGTDPQRSAPYQTAAGQTVQPLSTGDLYTNVQASWRKTSQVAVQQPNPLPLNIIAVLPDYLEGDIPEVALTPRQQRNQPQRQAA